MLPNPPLEAIPLARERGMPGVVSLLLPDTKVQGKEEREALREAVSTNIAQLLDRLPRDVEFDYNRKIDKLKPLLDTSFVPYAKLLKHLHLPKPHFGGMLPMCSLFCRQKQICRRVRETLDLVHLIVGVVGERIKVFEGIEVSMIKMAPSSPLTVTSTAPHGPLTLVLMAVKIMHICTSRGSGLWVCWRSSPSWKACKLHLAWLTC